MRPSFSEEIWKLRVSQVTLPVPLFAVVGARSAWTCKWTSATWNLQHINDIKLKWNGQFLFHPCTSLCYCQMLSKYNAWKENKQYVHLRHATPSLCFDSRLPLNGIGSPANPWNELSYQNQPIDTIQSSPMLTPFWLWGSSSSAGFRIRFGNLADRCCASWWIEEGFDS